MATLELCVRNDWAARFERLTGELRPVFGSGALAFEHIGSTSVPGLLAKPIVDILVTLRSTPLDPAVLHAMAALGFEFRGEYGVPERHFFARPDCHVHGFLPGQGEWATHLLFRDFLRADEGGRATYTRFKLRTAESVGWDRAAYQQAKDRYVTEFLPEAEAWAQGCGWRCPAIG
ncbi:MAG: GrpB family protein [Acidimicrobiia bacterium]